MIGHTVRERAGRGALERASRRAWSACAPARALAVERLIRFADGRARWMNVRLTPRLDADGRFLGYYATTSDIHEQKMVEQELRRTNTILSAHFDNTPLAVIEWDTELRIVRWSGQAEAIFGWSARRGAGPQRSTAGASSTRRTRRAVDAHDRAASSRAASATRRSLQPQLPQGRLGDLGRVAQLGAARRGRAA